MPRVVAKPKELIRVQKELMIEMAHEIRMPNPDYFMKMVEEMIEKYGISDCIYESCIREFSQLKLRELKEIHCIRIVRPFLLTWGQMTRWLGDVGVEKVFQKLTEEAFAAEIEPLRQIILQSRSFESLKELVVGLFDELMLTEFRSESKKRSIQKNVNYTTASKVLHLCCPDLFVMWDTKIRIGYHKYDGDGKDYFQFLTEMANFWDKLSDTIKELNERHHIRPTRIIDMYNWGEYNMKKMHVT